MNYFLSHSELENLRSIIDKHEKVADRLKHLSQMANNPEIQSKLQSDSELAQKAQSQLLAFLN